MTRAGLVAWLALAGCLRIADFTPPDPVIDGSVDGVDPDRPPAGVTATLAGGVVVVTGSFFELKFSASGAHFPDSLTIGSAPNLLSRAPACEQSGMGIQVFPAFTVDAAQGAGPLPEIIYNGGSVVQVRVPWTQNWTCSNGSNAASGTSTFTVYPDGRIVRHDDVRFTGAVEVGTMGCPCNPGDNLASFAIRAYTSLPADAFPVTPDPSGGDGSTIPPVGPSTQICASTVAHSVLYAFENEWARIRKIPAAPNGLAHALSFDIFLSSTLRNEGDATVATMLLSPDPATCGPLTTRMLALRDDVAIRASSSSTPAVLVSSPVHGIYELPATTPIVPDQVELRANTAKPIPAGFVVKLKFGGMRTRVTTSLPVSSYLVSMSAPDTALIFILAKLDDTTPIMVNAAP